MPKALLLLAVAGAALVVLTPATGGVFAGENGLIAYTCGTGICTYNPSTGVKNASFIATASDPSWSSDESKIAYVNGSSGITVANASGTSPVEIRSGPASQPTFSYDGNRVAYIKNNDIFSALSASGQAELQVTSTAALERDPAYSPSGTKIAYASDAGGTYHIWTVNSDGSGTATQLTTGVGERTPTWSPTGSTVVYSQVGTNELFAFFSGSSHDLLIAGTDPAYSPDGTKISFVEPGGSHRLVTIPATVPSTAPTPTVLDSSASLSQPDWQALAFRSTPPSSSSGPPSNTSYPTITLGSGSTTPAVGDFISASVGTWTGASPLTYAYQWKRCEAADPLDGPCFDITGAQSSSYTPVAADYGKRLRVQVTATNSQGSKAQNSASSAIVVAIAPVLRVTPPITEQAVVDQTLSLGTGTWDGRPAPTFTYSWRRCNPFGDYATCVQIPGATSATYVPTVSDIGFSIRVWITGTNLAGADVGITNHTFPVVDKQHFAPSSVSRPTVTGTVAIGRQLTGSIGTFAGDAPETATFVWQRCDATGAACRTIPDATKVVYHPSASDLGSTLRLTVTVKNAYGSIVVSSDVSEPVLAAPPHRKGRRIIGTDQGEYLAGGGFDDVILGRGGSDTLLGGMGDDRIDGGPGNDVLTGGPGADVLVGGSGSDTIYAADGERDIVDCGDGADRAVVDAVDVVKNCEVKETPSTPAPAPPPAPTIPTPGTPPDKTP